MDDGGTRNLEQWAASQARLGVGAEALLAWAIRGGFGRLEAMEAIGKAKACGAFSARAAPAVEKAEAGLWAGVNRSDPKCLMWMKHPELALFEGMASAGDMAEIVKAARPGLASSLVAGDLEGKALGLARGRDSSSRSFLRGECDAVDRLQDQIGEMLGVEADRMEPMQAVRYGKGGRYAPHYDHFHQGHPKWGGPRQRVATMVVYLSSPEAGGQTVVEPLGLRIAPKAGAAFYFAYPDEASRELALHSSAPCLGEKWVAVQWMVAGKAVSR